MKWRIRAKQDWKPWFAWFPVQLMDGTRVWLEMVNRKYTDEGRDTFVWWNGYRYKDAFPLPDESLNKGGK